MMTELKCFLFLKPCLESIEMVVEIPHQSSAVWMPCAVIACLHDMLLFVLNFDVGNLRKFAQSLPVKNTGTI